VFYQSGFIDLKTGHFYRNSGDGHPTNAHYIIDKDPLLSKMYEKETRYKDYEDFLIFRANFAKVGNCGQKCIVIRAGSIFKKTLKYCIRRYDLEDYEISEWVH
jgi:hypothetical protein